MNKPLSIILPTLNGPFGSGLTSRHYTSEGVLVVRLQNIRAGHFRAGDPAYISADHYATLGKHDVRSGDLLLAGLGDEKIPAGRACVAPYGIEPAMVKADCFRFRLDSGRVVPQFVAYQLSVTAKDATACLSTGATRQRINLQSSARRQIALPELSEQLATLRYVEAQIPQFETLIESLLRETQLIHEYRTRLIADVVTGKLDVREAAARLPDEGDAGDDIAEDLLEGNEPIDDTELDTEADEVEA